ncbi:MAG TPA: ROK family protein [Actinomycetota bacterium]|nr:ROK family protein [Actinomycetota bacterium]
MPEQPPNRAAGRFFGGVELGGTKVVCVAGSPPAAIVASDRFPTGPPAETLQRVVARLFEFQEVLGGLDAIGVASFGPVDLSPSSATYGCLLETPKPGWSGTPILRPLEEAFGVPVVLASDVEGAALSEGLSGAARGLESFVYITVGTGIGAGVVSQSRLLRGLLHPEFGHVAVPRRPGDDFPGVCPFHGACLEGMASGPAMAARWGMPAEQLTGPTREAALALEAQYLASGLRSLVYTLAPERIVIGGGVGLTEGLLPLVREALATELAGYPGIDWFTNPSFVAPAALGAMAGGAGALVLAATASSQYR